MKKLITVITTTATLALPLLVVAQTSVSNLSQAGQFIIGIINGVLVPVLFAVAFIVFIWGAFQAFILGANDDTAKSKGKNLMLYGLIGFFVMVSVWGLVNILTGSVGLNNSGVNVPTSGVNIGG
ncbi:hypothetical protein MNBD_CPR01-395 [hydrothermal vent metagenome]|uniref:Uncharacterized protein n=1 Tax=hydrothermal vent metagenome TaxID=652676 RepID=A0A3B0UMS6_9ZZZZ